MPETELASAEATRAWGRRLGSLLRAGDLVVLTGGLGAGKTTLTQGIADAMSVRGPVTSPTFVLSRVHPSLVGGPDLVHADAYRLTEALSTDEAPAPDGGAARPQLDAMSQLDALDLDATLADCVTVVEWGATLAPRLAADYLEVTLSGHGTRRAELRAYGDRWSTTQATQQLAALAGEPAHSSGQGAPC